MANVAASERLLSLRSSAQYFEVDLHQAKFA